VAFRRVFEQNAPFVWRCLRRLGVSEADVEDVCQEVFLIVHRKLAELDDRGSLRSWLYGVCVRKASDYRRLAHKKREQMRGTVPDRGAPPEQSELLDRKAEVDFLDGLLDRLEGRQRAVFVLYEIEQLAMAEVAEAVGCPLQTAYSRLHAARKQVAAAVKRQRAAEAMS